MMKFTNIRLNYANCTIRCSPSGTVVRKNCSVVNDKSLYDSSRGVQRPITSPWGGSRAPSARRGLLAAHLPHQLSARSTSSATDTNLGNLYEILGVSPKATQKEIKAAYYNLSMTYHPDKNTNCDVAARKFREITAAYEVLGNFLNRKKYDRGIMTSVQGEASAGGVSSYESHRGKHYRSQVSVHVGRSTIYNFDEWTREHYGQTIARTAARRAQYEGFHQKDANFEGQKNVELMMAVIGFMILAFTYATSIPSYDTPLPILRKNDEVQSQPSENDDK